MTNDTEARERQTPIVQSEDTVAEPIDTPVLTLTTKGPRNATRKRKFTMAELNSKMNEGTLSENPMIEMINPTAVKLAYERMPNTGDEGRKTYDLGGKSSSK
ncbi:hypothetical protein N7468_000573 [Penicillium chermesinum]|uniref:Uncharacterized protein n=1 Tax=Penicillium chermesinum TaxID=63820 RepID=A0A9W9PKK9_9EURO|nr:uncharacterized protein N7468_000573 [Penicillium chermesinum]KAJ5249122.1 hypothetical protein N7468_000573 [Penicillium chermesinum]